MIKQSILPMKSAPPPKGDTKKAVFMRVKISSVLLHACAKPFVQLTQAVKTSDATA